MTRPVVVVVGAADIDPPPNLDPAAEIAELRYADDRDTLAKQIAEADALFVWGGRRAWLEPLWPHAARLRWIQSASDGVDGLLFDDLAASEVLVTNQRGVFDDAIAEWAIGAMLAFVAGLHRSILDGARAHWDDDRRRERLAGQHLLVVGPGPIGRATAVRARALGMSVSAVGRSARTDDMLGDIGAPEDLHRRLGEADHVLDALPLTAATRHLFDAAAFDAMRPSARFYNVGRGGTVDEDALVAALRSGTIAGAALDVYEREPLPQDSPLWGLPNIIVSPHVCGDVDGWETAVVEVFADNLRRFIADEPLHNLVDTDVGFGVG